MKFYPVRGAFVLLLSLLAFHAIGESLYNEGQFKSLTSDTRALKAGDKVTVLIRESAAAVSAADTSTGRELDVSAGTTKKNAVKDGGALAMDRSFSGMGKTQRTGKITATITAEVVSVQPNGDLVITGRKMLIVNNEDQIITLEGVIRQSDVQEDNMVDSERVANAKIKIEGKGDLARAQNKNWIDKILDWLRIF